VFAIESFMNELAKAGSIDPVTFRLRHLGDPRAQAVIELAAEKFGWVNRKPMNGRGQGLAFAKYKNNAAYCAVAIELEVQHETGRVRLLRAVSAVDSDQAVNPDGLKNQIEGAIVQSASWTLHEAVVFDRIRINSRDWSTYPRDLRLRQLPMRSPMPPASAYANCRSRANGSDRPSASKDRFRQW